MYTSEFTLEKLKSQFQLTIQEQVALFEAIEPVNPSPLLRDILERRSSRGAGRGEQGEGRGAGRGEQGEGSRERGLATPRA